MSTDIRTLNRLRRSCSASWGADSEVPRPIVTMSANPEGCDAMMASFRTIASEMGLRHVHICLVNGLTDEHVKTLARKGPRLVTVTDIDGMPEDELPGLHARLGEGARTLVACLVHAPEENIGPIADAWRKLQDLRQRI